MHTPPVTLPSSSPITKLARIASIACLLSGCSGQPDLQDQAAAIFIFDREANLLKEVQAAHARECDAVRNALREEYARQRNPQVVPGSGDWQRLTREFDEGVAKAGTDLQKSFQARCEKLKSHEDLALMQGRFEQARKRLREVEGRAE